MDIKISNEKYAKLNTISKMFKKYESTEDLIQAETEKHLDYFVSKFSDKNGEVSLKMCKLSPSNQQIEAFRNEHYDLDKKMLEGAVKNYIRKNTKPVYVLDDSIKMFGEYYAKVYEPDKDVTLEVPIRLLTKES